MPPRDPRLTEHAEEARARAAGREHRLDEAALPAWVAEAARRGRPDPQLDTDLARFAAEAQDRDR